MRPSALRTVYASALADDCPVVVTDFATAELVKVADAAQPAGADWAAAGFDRILLDAPCSATGVLRRHPDIRLHAAADAGAAAEGNQRRATAGGEKQRCRPAACSETARVHRRVFPGTAESGRTAGEGSATGLADPGRLVRAGLARLLALVVTVVTFALSVVLYAGFDTSTAAMQFTELEPWIETFSIQYHLGVDGFSVPLILLTAFFGPLVVIAGWEIIQTKVHQYMALFLIMEGLMVGVFCALDALLFYVFFEAMLIPMFLVIGMWGGPRRVYATIKFFLYPFLGSVFMLIGLIYLFIQSGSWSILEWHQYPLGLTVQKWLFLGFLAAFSVKIPMWPVHTWLPDAHVEAPTGGSVILAAIMLKIGGYGFVRFSLPITPDASAALDWLVITLSLIAVVYIGFVALVQKDMKKLIAYSSISHMGSVTLGLFLLVINGFAFALAAWLPLQGEADGCGSCGGSCATCGGAPGIRPTASSPWRLRVVNSASSSGSAERSAWGSSSSSTRADSKYWM